jgi:hypothetical protein
MTNDLDLWRSFRSDIPGPTTDAWARARAAIALAEAIELSATRAGEGKVSARKHRAFRQINLAPRHWVLGLSAALAAAVVAVGLVVALPTAPRPGNVSANEPYPLARLLASVHRAVPKTPSIKQKLAAAQESVPAGRAMRRILASRGVRVVVDGRAVVLADLALHTSGFDQGAVASAVNNAIRDRLDVKKAIAEVERSTVGLKQAVAYMTLVSLLVKKAKADGTYATVAQAESLAESSYQRYESSEGTPRQPKLPAGRTPKTAFFSPTAIAGYRQGLTVDHEITVIAGPSGDRTPTLARWMERQIKVNSVVIDGVPGVSAADVAKWLPYGL